MHLVSPPPLLPSMRNCTTCTVHTFAQLVKLCTKGFLTFGLVAVNMHHAQKMRAQIDRNHTQVLCTGLSRLFS